MKGLFWYNIEPGLPRASPKAGEKKAGVRGAVMLLLEGDSGAETLLLPLLLLLWSVPDVSSRPS